MTVSERNENMSQDTSVETIEQACPAADAGPRQPDMHFEPKWVCRNCGKVDNLHSSDGRCLTNRNPPVPQEAAPDDDPGNLWNPKIPDVVPVTAPDSAMRVAEQIFGYLADKTLSLPNEPAGLKVIWIDDIAALIREAGSRESRKPDGWAHQYHNCIRFNQGETVNGEQPFHAVPYWLETNGEAGSERERDAFESCAKELREHYNSDWDSTVPGAEFDAEILRILRKHLASRLLGGESK